MTDTTAFLVGVGASDVLFGWQAAALAWIAVLAVEFFLRTRGGE